MNDIFPDLKIHWEDFPERKGPDWFYKVNLKQEVLLNVINYSLGLRVGHNTKGAAYNMHGLFNQPTLEEQQELGWEIDLNRVQELTESWIYSFYNTISLICDFPRKEDEFNLLIVDQIQTCAEIYTAIWGRGVSDHRTFPKAHFCSSDSTIRSSRSFKDTQLREAFEWVLDELEKF